MEQSHIAMTKENAQQLLNYLASKPYAEVQPLIAMIQSCPAATIMPALEEGKAPTETPDQQLKKS